MSQQFYSLFTDAGLALLTEAIRSGTQLGITHMGFGDGNGELPVPSSDRTALENEVYKAPLNSLSADDDNKNWLKAETIISSAVGGFTIRELGLYAGDVLVAYSNYPTTYKPLSSEGTARIMTFRMILQIDNIADFNVIIDPDIVLATVASVTALTQTGLTNSRKLKEKVNESLSIKDFGGIGDGTYHTVQEWLDSGRFNSLQDIKAAYPLTFTSEFGDVVPELLASDSIDWLACNEWYRTLCKYGGKGFANNGVYVINKQLYSRLSATVNIECGDAKWVASANFPTTSFFSTGSSEAQDVYFTWKGGHFDVKNVPHSSAGQANDGWAFNAGNCKGATIEINQIYAGEDWTTAGSDTLFGSSGVQNLWLKIHHLQGAVDAGVYITRKQDGKTGTALFVDVNCYKCNVGVIVKRRYESAIINVAAQDCVTAAATGQAEITVNGAQLNDAHAGRNFVFHVNAARCQYPLFIQSTTGVQAFVNADKMGVNLPTYTSTGASVVRLSGSKNCQIYANCSGLNDGLTLSECKLDGVVARLIETEGSYNYAQNNVVHLKATDLSSVFIEEGTGTNNNYVEARVTSYIYEPTLVGVDSTYSISRSKSKDIRSNISPQSATNKSIITPTSLSLGISKDGTTQAQSYVDFFSAGSTTTRDGRIIVSGGSQGTNDNGYMSLQCRELFLRPSVATYATSNIAPLLDVGASCGSQSLRWSVVYSETGAINTSDERYKQDIDMLSDIEKSVALQCKQLIKKYRFKNSVNSKGVDARTHIGVIAQEVKTVFESAGLDPFEYGLLCHDTWEASEEITQDIPILDDDGVIIGHEQHILKEAQPAGDRYGIRYEELIMFILASV